MNEVPPTPPAPPAPAVPPLPGQRKPWVHAAALCSIGAPVVACAFGLSSSGAQTRMMKMVLGGAGTAVILAGFLLAVIALAGNLKQGRKGGKGLALAGLGINGAILLATVALIPALMRVARVWAAGYTVKEMMAMPQVIPGARVILNEPIGFRLEIPGEFLDNPQPQPAQMLYSFLCPDMRGNVTCINIERLGGRIRKEPLGPELYAGMRSQLPPDARIERAPASWKTYQLDAFGTQFSMEGRVLCAWVVQVPLAREAIQIGVGGPVELREDCHQLLNQLLTGLEGRSNWDALSGTIQSCGSDFHRRVPAVKTIPLERDKGATYGLLNASPDEIKAARQKVRFVIITGPGDFRYGHLWDIYEGGFRKDGFQARLIDDPLMGHVTCGPYPLRQALNFIERGRTQ